MVVHSRATFLGESRRIRDEIINSPWQTLEKNSRIIWQRCYFLDNSCGSMPWRRNASTVRGLVKTGTSGSFSSNWSIDDNPRLRLILNYISGRSDAVSSIYTNSFCNWKRTFHSNSPNDYFSNFAVLNSDRVVTCSAHWQLKEYSNQEAIKSNRRLRRFDLGVGEAEYYSSVFFDSWGSARELCSFLSSLSEWWCSKPNSTAIPYANFSFNFVLMCIAGWIQPVRG